MVVFHGGFPWWFSMVVFHGGFPWWFSMVVFHGCCPCNIVVAALVRVAGGVW